MKSLKGLIVLVSVILSAGAHAQGENCKDATWAYYNVVGAQRAKLENDISTRVFEPVLRLMMSKSPEWKTAFAGGEGTMNRRVLVSIFFGICEQFPNMEFSEAIEKSLSSFASASKLPQ